MTSRHGPGGPGESGPARSVGASARPPDASMTLITEFYRRPLDPGYAESAARRAAGQGHRPTTRSRVTLVALAVLLGLATTAATVALRQPASSVQQARNILEAQITERSADADATQATIKELTKQISSLQAQVLGDDGLKLSGAAAALAVRSGVVPVTGRGLRIELSDAPTDNPDTENPELRVQDVDLQVVVNGLWASGAEAIAVNGQRLTAMTAIRSAGDAILVDLVGVGSPYTIDAIGDPVAMQPALARTSAGQHLATLRTTYGIGVKMSSESALTLPGTGPVTLHSATVLGVTPSPGATGSVTGTAGASVEGASGKSGVGSSARPQGREGT